MTKRTQQKIAGRGFLRIWTSLFGGQTTIFGLGTSSSVRKKMGWSCKGERWKAKLRWKSSVVFFAPRKKNDVFPGKWIVRCFLQQIFMDDILNLDSVWGVNDCQLLQDAFLSFVVVFRWKSTWVGVVFLFILSFDWVFFHWFDLDFSVSGWFQSFSPGKFGGDLT